MKFEKAPRIIFKNDSFEKMMEYARAASGEIAGFCTVEEVNGEYHITETYIMPQKAHGGGVLIDAETIHNFMEWCKETGRPDRPAKARLWWHSHSEFGVFRSTTDTGTVALLRQVMPYLICMVVNKKRQYELTLYLPQMTITGMKATIEDKSANLRALVEAEVREMVEPWHFHTFDEHQDRSDVRRRLSLISDDDPMVKEISESLEGNTPEALYLEALNKGQSEVEGETPWQKYMREKGLNEPEQTDGEKVSSLYKKIHEMTDEEFLEYCKLHDAEPLLDDMPTGVEEKDDDTKRFIVEEGQIRPDPKARE